MRKIAFLLVAVTLTGCGSTASKDGSTAASPATSITLTKAAEPACSSFTGQRVTAATFSEPCLIDDATAHLAQLPVGTKFYAGTGTILCADNRVLIWNDLGWGYEGQPFNAFHVGDEQGAPTAETKTCNPS